MKHTILLFICLFSCGTNPSKNSSYIINQIDYYVQQTDNNKSLVESIIEGVITDEKGEKDTGGFEYYELYDDNRKELYRIRDYETINDLYFERLFYFKKMKLVFVQTKKLRNNIEIEKSEAYLQNSEVIYKDNISSKKIDFLINRAKTYVNQFKNSL